jgi:SAM-dependent methyltransferase
MRLLNLACGHRAHGGAEWTNVDFNVGAVLAKRLPLARVLSRAGIVSPDRLGRVEDMAAANVARHDLRRGIPFPDGHFDVVYHSHFFEHLDQAEGVRLLAECFRVLAPGGVIRVVVPDLRQLATAYVARCEALDHAPTPAAHQAHERSVADIFDQMVRRQASGPAAQRGLLGRVERVFRSPQSTGELHRWMYDRHSLARAFEAAGFVEVREETATTSRVGRWASYGLDADHAGQPWRPGSLFMEAAKP